MEITKRKMKKKKKKSSSSYHVFMYSVYNVWHAILCSQHETENKNVILLVAPYINVNS